MASPSPEFMITETYRGMVRRALLAPVRLCPPISEFFSDERWPQMVRYDHRFYDRPKFIPRDHFCFEPRQPGPSDSVWIVPGSTP